MTTSRARFPVRVCLVVDDMGIDAGTEKLVAALARRLDPGRFKVHVCCFVNSARLESLRPAIQTEIFPLVRVYSPPGLRQAWRFRRYLASNEIDIVHGFINKSSIFSVLGAVGSGRVVVTSRLNTGYWYTPRLLRLFRILNHYTTRIFTNSLCAKNSAVAREGVAPDKVTVVYPGVDLAQYGPQAGDLATAASIGIPSAARVVGIVATYRRVKDLALFLRGAQLVLAQAPDTAFLLVGHGELREELEKLAGQLGIRQNVFLTNGRGTVPDYLARMSIACLTSQSESLPNAILEYMATGLPVVATDVGGIAELVEDGVNGYLVRERTPEAVAAPILRLLEDESLRVRMGRRSLERCRREFDLSAAAKRLEDFYLSLVTEHEPALVESRS
jgi:L-malate glycosyltransferase